MNEQKQSLSIPIAIIVAGALIAGGIYMSGRDKAPVSQAPAPRAPEIAIPAVSESDYVLGDRKAPVMIAEYSDIECPFCKQFHATLHQLVTDYKGKVAVSFRHFPVHANSLKEGVAAECAGELGGNDIFWKYLDKAFAMTKSNNGLDLAELPNIAESIGLDKTAFNSCLSSGKFESKIKKDQTEVTGAGAQGTPYSVVFAKGTKIPITQGALPYADMKNIIEAILKN